MSARTQSGLKLLRELPGTGRTAEKGDLVIYNARFFLRRGEEVTRDKKSIDLYPDRLNIREVDGVKLIDHQTILGKRQPIVAVEKSLYGMQSGGYRELRASPHLCYGEAGVEGLIPANAALRILLWVWEVRPARQPKDSP